jgi:methionine-rich copper-binding protein CopC
MRMNTFQEASYNGRLPMRKFFVFGVFVASLLATFTVGLGAHLSVLKTMPADASNVSVPPERVQVWFDQQPSPRISRLELRGPNGQEVELGKLELHSEDRSISAPVPAALPPGKYEATWRAAGDDGHVMRGTFTFTVDPAK